MSRGWHDDLFLLYRLFAQARRYRAHLTTIWLLSLVSTPLALLTPVPLKIAVDHVIGNKPLPAFATALLPSIVTGSPAAILLLSVLLLVLVTLLQNLQGYGSWLIQTFTGEKLVLDFRTLLFRHVQRLSLAYHDLRGVADSLYRVQFDAPAVQYLLIQGIIPFVTSGLTLIAMIWITAAIDWQLSLISLTVLATLLCLVEMYRRRVRNVWAEVKSRESVAMSVVQEALSAIRVVQAFRQENREEGRFYRHASDSLQTQLRAIFMEAKFGILVSLIIAGGAAATLFVGVHHVQAGMLSVGELLIVIAYLAQLYGLLETMSKKVGTLQASLASTERLFSVLDESPDVVETKSAQSLNSAKGAVNFRNVHFAYGCGQPVLQGISFNVEPTMRVGISGPTGAGKTTLASLVPRFYDPTAGQVLLDGVDLREYRLADLRRQCSIVLQEPVLFSTTIGENIAYGRPGATEEEIKAAAGLANAHEFIMKLPERYQTPVGERGIRLSGGQRQRVSIARAFLCNSPILILDEPTSSVDATSEAAIVDALERLMRHRTTFIISHRPTTLQNCDLHLYLEHGRLFQGSPLNPSQLVSRREAR
jgi:ATP-binding cassette, subfamily B, bacterial